jgi:hypothetical protein
VDKILRDTPIWKHRPHVELRLAGARRYKKLSWVALSLFALGAAIATTGPLVDSFTVFLAGLAVAILSYILIHRWVGSLRSYEQSVVKADKELEELADAIGITVTKLVKMEIENIEKAGRDKLFEITFGLSRFEKKLEDVHLWIMPEDVRVVHNRAMEVEKDRRKAQIAQLERLLTQFALNKNDRPGWHHDTAKLLVG